MLRNAFSSSYARHVLLECKWHGGLLSDMQGKLAVSEGHMGHTFALFLFQLLWLIRYQAGGVGINLMSANTATLICRKCWRLKDPTLCFARSSSMTPTGTRRWTDRPENEPIRASLQSSEHGKQSQAHRMYPAQQRPRIEHIELARLARCTSIGWSVSTQSRSSLERSVLPRN